jgi:hypothetical protein
VCTYMKKGGLNELEHSYLQTKCVIVTVGVGVTEGRRYFLWAACWPALG